jgi:hypothetical protein
MPADYILPGTVVLLKLFFRLFVGHSASRIEIAKAALAFPIDLAFLAISFSAVFLGYMQSRAVSPLSTGATLGIFVLYILAGGTVALFVKKADGAFVMDRHLIMIAWNIPAYFISTLAIFFSIWAKGG